MNTNSLRLSTQRKQKKFKLKKKIDDDYYNIRLPGKDPCPEIS